MEWHGCQSARKQCEIYRMDSGGTMQTPYPTNYMLEYYGKLSS